MLMSGTALSTPDRTANAEARLTVPRRGLNSDDLLAAAAKPAAGKPLPKTVDKIEAMRAQLDVSGRSRLLIDREESAGRFIYRILNPDTGETMRQWPPEGYLDLIAYLRDGQGGLLDQRA